MGGALLGLCGPLVLAACGDDPTEAPACVGTESVELEVTRGLTPRFTWTPACRAHALYVAETAPDAEATLQWSIVSPVEMSLIQSGIVYGMLPAGVSEEVAAKPLQPGHQYIVAVFHWTNSGPAASDAIGFTP